MALTTRHKLNKSLQSAFPRGTPFDHQELTKLGVSSALAHHYLKSGWLARLGRGVFMFPNDTLRRDDCLKFLSRRVKGFHVGGKTALAWRGVRHNLPAREPLSLWGEGKAGLPEWFQKLFPARYTTRNPFSSKLPKNFGLQPLPETPDGVLVSVPERALLEMLSEVGVYQGIEEARNIMEGARVAATGGVDHAGQELPARQSCATLCELGRGIELAVGRRCEKGGGKTVEQWSLDDSP